MSTNFYDLQVPDARGLVNIGARVWYHDPQLEPMHIPRAAVVVGRGADPSLVNLLIYADGFHDVAQKRRAPVFNRRNVAIFAGYPSVWGQEPFAVMPELAVQQLQDPSLAPKGGVRPDPGAAWFRLNAGDSAMQPYTPPQPPPPPGSQTPAKTPAAPQGGPETPSGGKDGEGDEEKRVKIEVQTAATAELAKIIKHPAWGRGHETLEHGVIKIMGDKIQGWSDGEKVVLARIQYDAEGYQLWARTSSTNKNLGAVLEGVKDAAGASELITMFMRVMEHGGEATSREEAHEALQEARSAP